MGMFLAFIKGDFLRKIKFSPFCGLGTLWYFTMWTCSFLRTRSLVWRFLNRSGKNLYKAYPPNLNWLQKNVLDDLVEHGISLVHLDELFPGKDVTSELIEEVQHQKKEAKIGEKKPFLQYVLGENSILDLKNPFIRLSLRPEILDIVNSYLGMCSKLIYFDLAITKVMHTGEPPLGSQRWHRDRGINRMVKVFIYLVDVDEESGPFTYVLQSHAGGRWRTLFPQKQFGRHGFYPPEGSVDHIVPKDDMKCCIGRAGTVIFCDTTGLHKGGFSTSKQRIMFTSAYVAKGDVQRPEFRYPTDFKERAKQLNVVSQFAVT